MSYRHIGTQERVLIEAYTLSGKSLSYIANNLKEAKVRSIMSLHVFHLIQPLRHRSIMSPNETPAAVSVYELTSQPEVYEF